MVVVGVGCITFSETTELACCGVPDGNGICFTDIENEQIMSLMLNSQEAQ
jgi:hypothetical protein